MRNTKTQRLRFLQRLTDPLSDRNGCVLDDAHTCMPTLPPRPVAKIPKHGRTYARTQVTLVR